MTAATVALTVGSNIAQLQGQKQAYEANTANAAKSMRLQNQQTNFGIQQQEAADSMKAQQTQSRQLEAASIAAASAGESGTSGNSVDALINSYKSAEGTYMSNLATQQNWNRQQATMNTLGQSAQAQRQINSVAKPDVIGAALRIGGDSLGAYDRYLGPSSRRTPLA